MSDFNWQICHWKSNPDRPIKLLSSQHYKNISITRKIELLQDLQPFHPKNVEYYADYWVKPMNIELKPRDENDPAWEIIKDNKLLNNEKMIAAFKFNPPHNAWFHYRNHEEDPSDDWYREKYDKAINSDPFYYAVVNENLLLVKHLLSLSEGKTYTEHSSVSCYDAEGYRSGCDIFEQKKAQVVPCFLVDMRGLSDEMRGVLRDFNNEARNLERDEEFIGEEWD